MKPFKGFPAGSKLSPTAFPAQFFNELLPIIDDLAELKLTLFCFWALHQKEGRYRYVTRRECATSPDLISGLEIARPNIDPHVTLDTALKNAVERGTLLCIEVVLENSAETLYFVNTELGRTAVKQIEAQQWIITDDEVNPVKVLPERPNIYKLYEDNIGPLTPLIGDALKDAEKSYALDWIVDAIRIATLNEKRSWRYIQAVLKRWEREGKKSEVASRRLKQDERRYIASSLSEFIER